MKVYMEVGLYMTPRAFRVNFRGLESSGFLEKLLLTGFRSLNVLLEYSHAANEQQKL